MPALPMWKRVFAGELDWQLALTALIATVLLAWLAARSARWLTAAGLRALVGEALVGSSSQVRRTLRVVFVTSMALVTALLFAPALDWAGLRPLIGQDGQEIADWLLGRGLRVGLIALVAYALVAATRILVQRFEFEVSPRGTSLDEIDRAKRAHTLGNALRKTATGVIVAMAGAMILNEVGVDIGPVLAGAGIVGLAVGFGAQTLVRDVISGFLLILEDQVRVGDDATINGTDGTVEQINLRTIVLRDATGSVHVFPNGAIDTLANHSKDYSHYVVDLSVAYDEDPDRIAAIVAEVDRDMRDDPQFASLILEPIAVLGVSGFSDWSMQVRISIKTLPAQRFAVGREFRKRLRKALNQHGIEVPYPVTHPRT